MRVISGNVFRTRFAGALTRSALFACTILLSSCDNGTNVPDDRATTSKTDNAHASADTQGSATGNDTSKQRTDVVATEGGAAKPATSVEPSENSGTIPLTIETRREDVDIAVESDADAKLKTQQHLKQVSAITAVDSLSSTEDSRKLGQAKVLRFQQEHNGIPVYGAEVSAVVVDGKITHLESKTLSDIDVDINPALSYDAVIKRATDASGHKITPQDGGRLVIYKRGTAYILCWLGMAGIESEMLNVLFNANNATVVARYPVAVHEGAGHAEHEGAGHAEHEGAGHAE